MIRLAVAIQHHPRRAERIPPLLSALGAYEGVTIVVVEDRDSEGVWPTYQRCLRAAPVDASHVLVLQDDVLPCRDFLHGSVKALAERPHDLVSFFGTRAVIARAREQGGSWATVRAPLMGQAFCWPQRLIGEFLTWEHAYIRPDYDPRLDDSRICAWCLVTGRRVWYTAPSLVEHDGFDQSLIGNAGSVGGRPRRAKWFIGSDASALSVNWSRGSLYPPHDGNGSLSAYASCFRDGKAPRAS